MAEFQGRRATARRLLPQAPARSVEVGDEMIERPPAPLRTESRPAGLDARLMALEARMTSIEIAMAALDHDLQELVTMTAEAVEDLHDQLEYAQTQEGPEPEGEPDQEPESLQFLFHVEDEDEPDEVAAWAEDEARRLRQAAQGEGVPEVDLDVEVPEEGVQVRAARRNPYGHLADDALERWEAEGGR